MPAERGERRLAAILAADVAGYSRLMGADEGGTLRQLKAHRLALFDPKVARHRGRIVKTSGDGMLVEFVSVVDAVRCAVEIQRGMAGRNAGVPEAKRIELRIGINVGDIVIDGGDIFGDGVNLAARLEALAEPGGICVSGRVQEDTAGRLALSYEDMGEQQVKNIARPVRVFALGPKTISALPARLDQDTAVEADAPRRWREISGTIKGWRRSFPALVLLAIASVGTWQVTERLVRPTGRTATRDVAQSAVPTVAVLSFDNLTGDPAQDYFSEGLGAELTTVIGQFEPLRVVARDPRLRTKARRRTPAEIGRRLRAQYLVEGSFRHVGDKISVTAQLIDARAGNQNVWAQTFERAIGPANLLEIQNDVAQRIGAAIGDPSGAIARSEWERARAKAPGELSPYECMLAAHLLIRDQTSSEFARRARLCSEAVVGREPENGLAWSTLSRVLAVQRWWGTGLDGAEATDVAKRAYLVDRVVAAANRGVDFAPGSAWAHFALFNADYVACERERMKVEAERVLAINPNDPAFLGMMGNQLAFAGFWDFGVPLAEKALKLAGPAAPRWWWWAAGKDHYRKGEYDEALDYFRRAYVEQNWLDHLHLAFTLPYVGKVDEARAEIPVLMKLKPTISVQEADRYYAMWCLDQDFRAKITSALRLAGLREEREQAGHE
jgi:class 3 adenylate cyclase/TolB-like protein